MRELNEIGIDLGDELKQFIEREVLQGRFGSAAEVIEAGLLVLQERETRLAALRSLIEESEHAVSARVGKAVSDRDP